MKKITLTLLVSTFWPFLLFAAYLVLIAPQLAFGADSDVQFGSGSTMVVTAGSALELTVSGNMESLEVAGGTFTPAVTSGVAITSNDRTTYTYGTGIDATFSCGGTSSTLTLSGGGTMVITPTGTTCQQQSGGSGGGGTPTASPSPSPPSGGGGGGGPPPASPSPSPLAVVPAVPAVPAVPGGPGTPATPAIPAIPASPALIASPVFNSNFGPGSRGEFVRRLQQLLNSDPETRISDSGAGSPGNETERFGGLTRAALIKFQVKHGVIASVTAPGAGNVGPLTRTKLEDVFGAVSVPVQAPTQVSAPTAFTGVSILFSRNLVLGSAGEDVKRLQQLLNSDPETRISDSGAGSPGNETERFGGLTRAALIKFQVKHGVIASVTAPGAGNVGPLTRTKLEDVFGGGQAPQVPQAPSPSAPGASSQSASELQAQLNAAQEQLNALLQQLQQQSGQ